MTDITTIKKSDILNSELTLNSLYSEFIATLQVKQETIKTYNKGLKNFIKWSQTKGLKEINRNDLIEYIKAMETEGLKPNTIKLYMASLKAFYKFLEIQYNIKDITKGLKTPKINTEFKKDALTGSQVKDLIRSIDNIRDKIIILLGVTCGLRTAEISKLDIKDLETKAGTPILWVLGKARDEKEFIILPDKLYKIILEYLSNRTDENPALILGTSNNSSGRLATGSISWIIKTHLRQIGLNSDRLTAHSLRHTAITQSLLNGNSLRETQIMARHKNINTTLIYAHDLNKLNNKCSNSIMNNLDI